MVAKIENALFLLKLQDIEIVRQRFCVAEEQSAVRLQHLLQICVQLAAGRRVEIDRHVAQQNNVHFRQQLLFDDVGAVE